MALKFNNLMAILFLINLGVCDQEIYIHPVGLAATFASPTKLLQATYERSSPFKKTNFYWNPTYVNQNDDNDGVYSKRKDNVTYLLAPIIGLKYFLSQNMDKFFIAGKCGYMYFKREDFDLSGNSTNEPVYDMLAHMFFIAPEIGFKKYFISSAKFKIPLYASVCAGGAIGYKDDLRTGRTEESDNPLEADKALKDIDEEGFGIFPMLDFSLGIGVAF